MNHVSIIVPCYNAASTLRETLDSILRQTYPSWECICVNDGSSDDTQSIIDEYALRDQRIKPYRQSNQGVSSARNRGIQLAQSPYFTFIDADDWYEPGFLKHMMEPCLSDGEESPTDLVVSHFYRATSSQESKTPARSLLFPPEADPAAVYPVHEDMINATPLFSWGMIFKKSILNRHALTFKTGIVQNEDMLFVTCYLMHTNNIRFVDRYLYNYRISAGGACGKYYGFLYPASVYVQAVAIWSSLLESDNKMFASAAYSRQIKTFVEQMRIIRLHFWSGKSLRVLVSNILILTYYSIRTMAGKSGINIISHSLKTMWRRMKKRKTCQAESLV